VRKVFDFRRVQAADCRHALRRVRQRPFPEGLETERVVHDVVVIEEVVADQHVHHSEGQGAVGSRQQGDVLVTLVDACRAAGVDGDQACSRLFAS
jgi:hypothetical protein